MEKSLDVQKSSFIFFYGNFIFIDRNQYLFLKAFFNFIDWLNEKDLQRALLILHQIHFIIYNKWLNFIENHKQVGMYWLQKAYISFFI